MNFRPIAISLSMVALMLGACSSATTSQRSSDDAPLSFEVPATITSTNREVTWKPDNMLNIIPPKSVMDTIGEECKAQGFDRGYITSIALQEDTVTAIFNCRGAG